MLSEDLINKRATAVIELIDNLSKLYKDTEAPVQRLKVAKMSLETLNLLFHVEIENQMANSADRVSRKLPRIDEI